jgi:TetR/AcrR family transcriptional regulator, transcriptional repressor for nem operon
MPRRPASLNPRADTRSLLLDAAQSFVQRASYDGFSFRDLAEVAGIRKASIYHHFETKEALAVAMLERVAEGFQQWAQAQSALPPAERLRAYCLDLYAQRLGAGTQLCPAGAFTATWPALPPAVQRAARRVMDRQVHFLAETLEAGAANGSLQLPAGRSSLKTAIWLGATVQGALAVSRAFDGRDSFLAICEQTLAVLGAGS